MHTVRIRFVGSGSFGSFVAQLIQSEIPSSCVLLPAFTRSCGLSWAKDVVSKGNEVDGVYICTPDSEHQLHAVQCLQAGKHVLVEKPVTPDFEAVLQAKRPGQVLMVGFHRRFDSEFLRAKEAICAGLSVASCLLRACDPCPKATQGFEFVLNNSVCHEIDMLSWLWPASTIEWTRLGEGSALEDSTSGILLIGKLQHGEGNSTNVRIEYRKTSPHYTNVLMLDGNKFGYENFRETPCCSLYNNAYVAQWRRFTDLCSGVEAESAVEEASRLTGYSRSFRWLHQACRALRFPMQ